MKEPNADGLVYGRRLGNDPLVYIPTTFKVAGGASMGTRPAFHGEKENGAASATDAKRLLGTAFVIVLLASPDVRAADPVRERILLRVGQAVGIDENIPIRGAVVVATATVTAADAAQWQEKVNAALSVLYAPPSRAYQLIRYADLRDIMPVEMEGGRTPERVVTDVVRAGRIVAVVKWQVGPILELESLAVFDAETLLFDTLLSMPVIHEPVFSTPHL
jgi:hypothetical protein